MTTSAFPNVRSRLGRWPVRDYDFTVSSRPGAQRRANPAQKLYVQPSIQLQHESVFRHHCPGRFTTLGPSRWTWDGRVTNTSARIRVLHACIGRLESV